MFKVKSSLRVPQSPELWWMSRMNHPKFDRFSLELWCIRQLKIQKKTTKLYINFTLIQFAQQKKLVLRNKSHENQWKLQNSYILVIFPWFYYSGKSKSGSEPIEIYMNSICGREFDEFTRLVLYRGICKSEYQIKEHVFRDNGDNVDIRSNEIARIKSPTNMMNTNGCWGSDKKKVYMWKFFTWWVQFEFIYAFIKRRVWNFTT